MRSVGKSRKIENHQQVSPSRQWSSTPAGFGQGFFFVNEQCATLEHSPYSPDLAAADFYLLPVTSTEISIKGAVLL
jgi:hypothetical protein